MVKKASKYRKNIGLLIAFVAFLTILYIIAVFLGRVMMTNYVQSNSITARWMCSMQPKAFNNFFNNSISEVSPVTKGIWIPCMP